MRSICGLALWWLAVTSVTALAGTAEIQAMIASETAALRAAKPAERPTVAENLIKAYVQLSEGLLSEGKFPAAFDALHKAKGLTIHLAPTRGAEVSGQMDVRMTIALWRQANAGRGLHAEFFQGNSFDNKIGERTDPRVSFYWDRSAPIEGLEGDAFLARWTGFIVAPQAATYSIIAHYDDRCRVSIDDQDVIDGWNESKGRSDGLVKLTGRPQPIKVEFRNTGGPAHLNVQWALLGSKGEAIIPPEAFFTDKAAAARLAGKAIVPLKGFGLVGAYFDGDFQRQEFERIDSNIDFIWQDTHPNGVKEQFSVRWKGFLRAPRAGKYQIKLIHDDGARLWIDDQPIVSGWSKSGTHDVSVELTGKPQPIVIELINTGGPSKISMQWAPAGGDQKHMLIPPSAFYSDLKTAENAP
jgi:hypothetical protein